MLSGNFLHINLSPFHDCYQPDVHKYTEILGAIRFNYASCSCPITLYDREYIHTWYQGVLRVLVYDKVQVLCHEGPVTQMSHRSFYIQSIRSTGVSPDLRRNVYAFIFPPWWSTFVHIYIFSSTHVRFQMKSCACASHVFYRLNFMTQTIEYARLIVEVWSIGRPVRMIIRHKQALKRRQFSIVHGVLHKCQCLFLPICHRMKTDVGHFHGSIWCLIKTQD